MPKSNLELLQAMAIFGGLRDDILEFLLARATILSVAKGDYFFHENENGSSMFVLQEGRVAVVKSWKDGEHLLRELNAGDCFGEMALIDFCARSASVYALADCHALELTAGVLHELYEKDLEQLTMFHMNMSREVSRRLRVTDDQLFAAIMEKRGVDNSLISYLG